MRAKINRGTLTVLLGCLLTAAIAVPAFSQSEADTNQISTTSTEDLLQKAQNLPPDEYYRALVLSIVREVQDNDEYVPATQQFYQIVRIKFLTGREKSTIQELPYYPGSQDAANKLKKGDRVVVQKVEGIDMPSYAIIDRYRLDKVAWIVGMFLLLVIALSGAVGLRGLLGLAFSIGIIVYYMIPAILEGRNPMFVSIIAATVITVVSIYIAHGFKLRTSIALGASFITLLLSIVFATLAVRGANLFGLGSEEAFYVQLGQQASINLQGLLLGAIIIGLIGVLDDITTAQAAVVEELKKANPRLPFHELYQRGQSVGREHIASLINTLALAYVGASMPLMLLFRQYQQPLSLILNGEPIAEEIIRTVVGSATLILAVPITTALAAFIYGRKKIENR